MNKLMKHCKQRNTYVFYIWNKNSHHVHYLFKKPFLINNDYHIFSDPVNPVFSYSDTNLYNHFGFSITYFKIKKNLSIYRLDNISKQIFKYKNISW